MAEEKKYSHLYKELRREIENGYYSVSERLPTEKELADKFNVSRQTVRKALELLENDSVICRRRGSGSYISDKVVIKPNTHRICVITTYIGEYIFPAILCGIEKVFSENNFSMMLNATNNNVVTERRILLSLLREPTDGIVVEGTRSAFPNPNAELYESLADMGIPIVFINSKYANLSRPNIISVVTDDYAGGRTAVKKLVEMGHKRIGGLFKSDDQQGISRYFGFINELISNEAEKCDADTIWFNTENKESFLRDSADAFKKITHRCTALVCYNDEIALKVLDALDDDSTVNSLISFDHNLTFYTDLFLYSFEHPKTEMGILAATKLINMIKGQTEESLVIPWKL